MTDSLHWIRTLKCHVLPQTCFFEKPTIVQECRAMEYNVLPDISSMSEIIVEIRAFSDLH